MGHVHMPPLPATRKWKHVIDLIAGGAAAAQLATATIAAAEKGFRAAPNDPGVVEVYWLLVRLPIAARSTDFADALRQCGMGVPNAPTLLDIGVAFSDAVDARIAHGKCRSDLTEMARTAAVEAINSVVGTKAQSLFGTGPDEVRAGFAALATVKQFGSIARQFFARFSFKCLAYFLSKAIPAAVGEGKRFPTVHAQKEFTDALAVHCREASGIAEFYAGKWFSLHDFQAAGDVTREETAAGFAHAMTKLIDEFRVREGARGS